LIQINLGDNPIPYNENFQLFVCTKLSNPHFMPELGIKMAIINFSVNADGLEE
jgi:dynein heavy chain